MAGLMFEGKTKDDRKKGGRKTHKRKLLVIGRWRPLGEQFKREKKNAKFTFFYVMIDGM